MVVPRLVTPIPSNRNYFFIGPIAQSGITFRFLRKPQVSGIEHPTLSHFFLLQRERTRLPRKRSILSATRRMDSNRNVVSSNVIEASNSFGAESLAGPIDGGPLAQPGRASGFYRPLMVGRYRNVVSSNTLEAGASAGFREGSLAWPISSRQQNRKEVNKNGNCI